jgi:nucleotide-binding universal stress UspA family protein
MISLRRILVPTDFSSSSKSALRFAAELASRFESELHVLHVIESAVIPDSIARFAARKPIEERRTPAAASFAGDVLESGPMAGREVVSAAVEGVAAQEIVRYAGEHGIDLIVLGSHGNTGLAHILLGSIAEAVVRTAPCPVLTVKRKLSKRA